jgi:hypothetical protein
MRLTLLLFLLTFISSCSNPDKLILGKWKFDHIDTQSNSPSSNALDELTVALNSMIGESYKDMYMEFYSTGECVIYKDAFSDGTKRPYYLTADKKYIVTETEDVGEERIEIVRLDDNELVVIQDGLTLVLVRE